MKINPEIVNVMVDLETTGKKPGCVVLSIGACTFGADAPAGNYYERIDQLSYPPALFHSDPQTLEWWSQQDALVREEAFGGTQNVRSALMNFANWLHSFDKRPVVWGCGVDFDIAILEEAYELLHMEIPWQFRDTRCYRTLKNLYPEIKFERTGVHHNAASDARHQALHAEKIFAVML